MPSYIAGLGTLIAHPFNFLPGLQSGKEGVQGVIGGGLRMSTFLEHFMKVGSIAYTHSYPHACSINETIRPTKAIRTRTCVQSLSLKYILDTCSVISLGNVLEPYR
jgi:hypothetical protein